MAPANCYSIHSKQFSTDSDMEAKRLQIVPCGPAIQTKTGCDAAETVRSNAAIFWMAEPYQWSCTEPDTFTTTCALPASTGTGASADAIADLAIAPIKVTLLPGTISLPWTATSRSV
ncbi:hypothetical protein AX018_100851 [Paracidovorax anthurii]|uniref:Uncharacterized protein n=1 Tax=Paracidovorax anthurii TaxID=78229 RepID=A0A328ZG49_9BURK|nr:hypothetical protein AX018_100851 [Paracidovorax anthurii]